MSTAVPQSRVPAQPLPPTQLADRVGSNALEGFLADGRDARAQIDRLLPRDWTWAGKRVLDFGCGAGRVLRHFVAESAEAQFVGCDIDEPSVTWMREHVSPPFDVFVAEEAPPLAQPDASFDLVYAISVFTHITDEWSGWLLDLHRVLKPDGLLIASLLGGGMSEQVAGEPWHPEHVGMNVLERSNPWSRGGPSVFISEWWLRAHWGRIFEILLYQPMFPGQDFVLLRRRPVIASRDDLERPEPREPREYQSLRHNLDQLHNESRRLREQLARVEGSASWRLTSPLRAAKHRLRR